MKGKCTCDPNPRNSDGSENGMCSFCQDFEMNAERDLLNELHNEPLPLSVAICRCQVAPADNSGWKNLRFGLGPSTVPSGQHSNPMPARKH